MKRQNNAYEEWKVRENLVDFAIRNYHIIFIMNSDKQRIAIAEFCGWKEIGKSGIYQNVSKGVNGCMPNGEVHKKRIKMKLPGANSFLVPDYLNDLNAMHKAEHHLSMNMQDTYMEYITDITGIKGWGVCHALAEVRAEAFLKTIGKWEE